jgi:hypothetical protein
MEQLDACDGIIFGCATYMGVALLFSNPLWKRHSVLIGWSSAGRTKLQRVSPNSASQNGDKLSTLFQLIVLAMQMGMLWIGVSDLPGNNWSGGSRTDLNRLGTWVGAMGHKQCR